MWNRPNAKPAPEDVSDVRLRGIEYDRRVDGRRRVGGHRPCRIDGTLVNPDLFEELPAALRIPEKPSQGIVCSRDPGFPCGRDVCEISHDRERNSCMNPRRIYGQTDRAQPSRGPFRDGGGERVLRESDKGAPTDVVDDRQPLDVEPRTADSLQAR